MNQDDDEDYFLELEDLGGLCDIYWVFKENEA